MKLQYQKTLNADDRGRVALGPEFANQQVSVTVERNIDVGELPTRRAVHFLNASDFGRATLYAGNGREEAESLIGIDYGTGPAWSRKEYASHDHDKAIDDYNQIESTSDGSLVAAYYGRRKANHSEDDPFHLNHNLVLGVCMPGSTVEPVPVENTDGGTTFIKTLPLTNTVEVSRDDGNKESALFDDFAAGRSIYHSPAKDEIIREVYEDRFY